MLGKAEIRVIYDQGMESMATTIKQLYEMVEAATTATRADVQIFRPNQ